MGKRILFVARGRPGLGHVIPCVALGQALEDQGLDTAYVSYGVGHEMLSWYPTLNVLDVDYIFPTSGYPGLPLFRGIYPALKKIVVEYKPSLLIGSGEFLLPILSAIEQIPCCMLANTTYLTIESGYFSEIRSLLHWLYNLATINLEYNLISNIDKLPFDLRTKFIHVGPILRSPQYSSQDNAKKALGFAIDQPLVVVSKGGGDQLSSDTIKGKPTAINMKQASLNILHSSASAFPELYDKYSINMVLIGGLGLETEELTTLKGYAQPSLKFVEFTANMTDYLQAADLIVGRAGFNFLSEALAYGKKLILVPISSDSEQVTHAIKLNELGLCRYIPSNELSPQTLLRLIGSTLGEKETPTHTSNLKNFAIQGTQKSIEFIIKNFNL